MKTNRLALVCIVLLGLGVITLAGCGNKVTKSNFDQIKAGMTLAQVEAILGKGTESTGAAGAIGNLAGSAKVVTWKDVDKTITVTFANDKVVLTASSGL
jgi:outer membrane protein assembly factor BamE (lipoprotein component of BamABCDE complex)